MFDIGWGELVVIGIVALVVIGPKELPGVVRTIGQSIAKLRRMASDFQSQFNEAMREAELADLKKDAEKMIEGTIAFNPIEKASEELKKAVESSPVLPITADAPVPPSDAEKLTNEKIGEDGKA
jgi:sec-independent protein translocase protein TatB